MISDQDKDIFLNNLVQEQLARLDKINHILQEIDMCINDLEESIMIKLDKLKDINIMIDAINNELLIVETKKVNSQYLSYRNYCNRYNYDELLIKYKLYKETLSNLEDLKYNIKLSICSDKKDFKYFKKKKTYIKTTYQYD